MSVAGGINEKPSIVIIQNFADQNIVIKKSGRNIKQMERVYVYHLTVANTIHYT